jgi:hypothetical protein
MGPQKSIKKAKRIKSEYTRLLKKSAKDKKGIFPTFTAAFTMRMGSGKTEGRCSIEITNRRSIRAGRDSAVISTGQVEAGVEIP